MTFRRGYPLRRAGATALALSFALACSPVAAKQWFVQSGGADVAFDPQFLTIQAGDTVTFLNLGGNHNVVADDGSFRCAHGCDDDGHGGNGNATDGFWFFSLTFAAPGTYGYFCEPHGSPGSGMYGSIEVLAPLPPPIDPAPGGDARSALALATALAVSAWAALRRRTARRAS